MRQAFAGMLWSKQLYDYDVVALARRRPDPAPPPGRRLTGRNTRWRNFDAFDIMSMPDKWEYPWFAAWDLGFHCVALAHVDPAFAKYQLLLICREWFQHPNGALPAYEWDFGDVNPPVQAWAALEVFAIDGARDLDFLSRDLRQAARELHVVGEPRGRRRLATCSRAASSARQHRPDRPLAPAGRRHAWSSPTPPAGWRSTRWPWRRSRRSSTGRAATGDATSCSSSSSTSPPSARRWSSLGVWDETDGLYYDKLVTPDGTEVPVKVRSMVGIIPLLAAVVVDEPVIARAEDRRQAVRPVARRPAGSATRASSTSAGCCAASRDRRLLLGVVGVDHLHAAVREALRRGRVPVAVRSAGPVGLPPRPPVRARRRRRSRPRSTTSRPSRRRRCSAATRTGGARCGSRSTTS